MAAIRYTRRDRLIRLARVPADDGTRVELFDGARTIRYDVLAAKVVQLTEQTAAADIALTLFGPEIRDGLVRCAQAVAGATGPTAPGADAQILERLCLQVEDRRLTGLPLQQTIWHVLSQAGVPRVPIPRLMGVPPRVRQVPFTLPLRLLQLDARGDFDLPTVVAGIFPPIADLSVALQARADPAALYARWALPPGWKSVDVLHLDQLPTLDERQLLAASSPTQFGTLGWLVRCTDLWRVRLVVMRTDGNPGTGLLRRFADRLAAQGGPAVWLVASDSVGVVDRLQTFYRMLIHDAPVDVAVEPESLPSVPSDDTLIVGCGREELLRVSAPGDDLASLARDLRDPDQRTRAGAAGRLWSSVAASHPDMAEAADAFAKTVRGVKNIDDNLGLWNFDVHEGDGLVPLGESIRNLRTDVPPAVPQVDVRSPPDTSGPRYVNMGLWQFDPAIGRTNSIPQQNARLRLEQRIVLGAQLGPRGLCPVLDATALIEEPFKWDENRAGVWLSVALTALDFSVVGSGIQEVWLPRTGASDLVEFVVTPKQKGISRVRLCVYFGADLLQVIRLAAIVEDATGGGAGTRNELAKALDVATDRIGDAGWSARMEYAAAANLAVPPKGRDVAYSIFANDLDGKRVFTSRGSEGYEVLIAGDTGELARDIRAELDAISRDEFGFYAFRPRDGVPLHSGTSLRRDAALHQLAHLGWTLFSTIFKGADRTTMAMDLAGEGRIIHVAHSLLENVLPWAVMYDRRYNIDRQKDDAGLPVLRAVCQAGLPDTAGKFPVTECGQHADCPLSQQGRAAAAAAGQGVAEDAIVCARHFWGFRHIIELPPFQGNEAATATAPDGAVTAAPATALRRDVTSAGKPGNLLLGYNAGLGSADAHRTQLKKLLESCKINAAWREEKSADPLLTALRKGDTDLVYLFCHARGGLADPGVTPPALEFQEAVGAPPSLIRAAALADGLHLLHHPLVILNGCNTAAFSPDALSPFIRNLVRDCDAAGAVGTEIPVFETLAGEVACQFLSRFLNGEAAGTALLGIRRELLARGNPLGLIYTLYAVGELTIAQA